MKFPIDVIKVDDQIVLIQEQITEKFITALQQLQPNHPSGYLIRSVNMPELKSMIIFINGNDMTKNYKFTSIRYSVERYEGYKTIIDHYKRNMGYE